MWQSFERKMKRKQRTADECHGAAVRQLVLDAEVRILLRRRGARPARRNVNTRARGVARCKFGVLTQNLAAVISKQAVSFTFRFGTKPLTKQPPDPIGSSPRPTSPLVPFPARLYYQAGLSDNSLRSVRSQGHSKPTPTKTKNSVPATTRILCRSIELN